jgi:formylglycine-generating enzyme required for sulfatase activity
MSQSDTDNATHAYATDSVGGTTILGLGLRRRAKRSAFEQRPAPDSAEVQRKHLELRKLQLDVEALEKPWWRSKDIIGFHGSVLIGILSLLATTVVGFYTTNEKIEDSSKRQLVSEAIGHLNSNEYRQRLVAGHRLASLDDRYNLRELKKAYEKSLAESEAAAVDPRYVYRTPYLRVGAVEAVALNRGLWRQDPQELTNFLRGALSRDPSVLVKHKAIQGLRLYGKLGAASLEVAYADETKAVLSLISTKEVAGGQMVGIPEIWAVIGSDDGDRAETPASELLIPAFWIDRKPVSNRQWKEVMRDEIPKMESDAIDGLRVAYFQGRTARDNEELPVVGVSFKQAKAYCAAHGRYLPTEVQWEVAARGRWGWPFPWGAGDEPAQQKLRVESVRKGTLKETDSTFPHVQALSIPSAVDMSPFSIVGMATSVKHWTASEWSDYAPLSLGHVMDCVRKCVLRGAAGFEADEFSSVDRFKATRRLPVSIREDYVDDNVGFRCAEPATRNSTTTAKQ